MVLQPITPEIAEKITRSLAKATYFLNPFYLVQNGQYEIRHGETLVYIYDRIDKTTRLMVPPNNLRNLDKQIEFVTDKELEFLKQSGTKIQEVVDLGHEYYYSTEDLIKLKGKEFSALRKAINHFKKSYKYKILGTYPKEKVIDFIKEWANNKDLSTYSDLAKQIFLWDLDDCINYVSLIGKLQSKNLFIEIDGKLAGFCMTCPITEDCFAAIQQKVDKKFEGISRFLYHEKAKLYDAKFFTTGTGAATPGLVEFKDQLRPSKKTHLSLVIAELKEH